MVADTLAPANGLCKPVSIYPFQDGAEALDNGQMTDDPLRRLRVAKLKALIKEHGGPYKLAAAYEDLDGSLTIKRLIYSSGWSKPPRMPPASLSKFKSA